MNRARPGGSDASVAVGATLPMRMAAANVATRTAFRRPDSTRNGAPSCRDGAVSAPNDGRVAGSPPATCMVEAGDRVVGRAAPGGGTGYEPKLEVATRSPGPGPPRVNRDAMPSGGREAPEEGCGAIEGVVEDRLEGVPEPGIGDELGVGKERHPRSQQLDPRERIRLARQQQDGAWDGRPVR